jgi:hypothetical protein
MYIYNIIIELYNIYNFIITEWSTTITQKGIGEQQWARRRGEEWWICKRKIKHNK